MANRYKIKVCGMRDQSNIRKVCALEPDYAGFIFYPGSKRYTGNILSRPVIDSLPPPVTPVAVFVNEKSDVVLSTAEKFGIRHIQLHGDETPGYCKDIRARGYQVIKAFGVGRKIDFASVSNYTDSVSHFLFDTYTTEHGGSGRQFNWDQLKNFPFDIPFFLSGGIGPDDLQRIREAHLPEGTVIDVNSRFEISPGIKDEHRLANFINELRSIKEI